METKLNINQWAEEDRPREKLLRQGAEALSNAELLAILIGSGSTRMSAVDLMKHVLSDCDNNLNTLGKLSISELTRYIGIGEAKAVTILAACELGKRRQATMVAERKDLGSATAIYNYMHPKLQDQDMEEAWALLMNHNFKLIEAKRISQGGLTETAIDVRVVMKEAILKNATVIAICHNHPSNNPTPSPADDIITRNIKQACDFMRLHFLDHVIITDGNYYSYREEGRLNACGGNFG